MKTQKNIHAEPVTVVKNWKKNGKEEPENVFEKEGEIRV